MTIVLVEYAADTNRDSTQLTEILDWLIVMTGAIDVVVWIGHCTSCS
jgi:hypothetical protein